MEKTLPTFLTEEEARKLLRAVSSDDYEPKWRQKRDKALLGVLLYCGLRRMEVRNLMVEHINFDDNFITVVQGKGRKDRVVPMAPVLKKWIQEYIKEKDIKNIPNEYLFFSSNKTTHLSDEGIKYLFRHLRAISGLQKHFSTHHLRHTFASLMVKGGADIVSLKEMLGHSKIETTMIYCHTTPEQLTRAMTFHPLGG